MGFSSASEARSAAPSQIDRNVVQTTGREPLLGNGGVRGRSPSPRADRCPAASDRRRAPGMPRASNREANRVNVVDDVGTAHVVEVTASPRRVRCRREVRLIVDRRVRSATPRAPHSDPFLSTQSTSSAGIHLIHLAHRAHRGQAHVEVRAKPDENFLFVAIGKPRHSDHGWNANVVCEVEEPELAPFLSIEGAHRIPLRPVEVVGVDRRPANPVVPPDPALRPARRARRAPAITLFPRVARRAPVRVRVTVHAESRRAMTEVDKSLLANTGCVARSATTPVTSRTPYPRRSDREPSHGPLLGGSDRTRRVLGVAEQHDVARIDSAPFAHCPKRRAHARLVAVRTRRMSLECFGEGARACLDVGEALAAARSPQAGAQTGEVVIHMHRIGAGHVDMQHGIRRRVPHQCRDDASHRVDETLQPRHVASGDTARCPPSDVKRLGAASGARMVPRLGARRTPDRHTRGTAAGAETA